MLLEVRADNAAAQALYAAGRVRADRGAPRLLPAGRHRRPGAAAALRRGADDASVGSCAVTAARIALATAAEFPDLDDDGPVLLGCPRRPRAHRRARRVDRPGRRLVGVRPGGRALHLGLPRAARRVPRLGRPGGRRHDAGQLRRRPRLEHRQDLPARRCTRPGCRWSPTDWLEPGDVFVVPEVGEYVVKPAVSAGSRDTNRYRRRGPRRAAPSAHVGDLLAAGRTVMVQPYLEPGRHRTARPRCSSSPACSATRCARDRCSRPGWSWWPARTSRRPIEPREPSPAERDAAEQVLDALVGGGAGGARRTCSTPGSTWCPAPTAAPPCWSSS